MQKYFRLAKQNLAEYLAEGQTLQECAFNHLCQVALQQKHTARLDIFSRRKYYSNHAAPSYEFDVNYFQAQRASD